MDNAGNLLTPEEGWAASSGGISSFFPRPSYQAGVKIGDATRWLEEMTFGLPGRWQLDIYERWDTDPSGQNDKEIARHEGVQIEARWALADWLLYRRISGRELARRAGLSRSTIHRLTSGHGQRVDLRTLARVCRVLDLTPGEIVVWQHDDPLPPGGRGRARQLRLPGRGWR